MANGFKSEVITAGAAVVLFLLLALPFYGFTIDDAFISLRYARNLAAGAGLTFNVPGPRVEGYTNFLWVILAAAFIKAGCGAAVLNVIKITGLVFGAASVVTGYLLTRYVFGRPAARFAAFAWAAAGNFCFWAAAGLETSIFVFLLSAALCATARGAAGFKWAGGAGILWAVAALCRPEGAVVGAAVLVGAMVAGRERRQCVGAAIIIFLFIYGLYFLWRWKYFGMFLPNTYYARGAPTLVTVCGRMRYLWPYLAFLFPFAFLALQAPFNRTAVPVWAAAAVTLLIAFVAKREWMPGYRYEIPFASLLTFLASAGVARFLKTKRRAVVVLVTAALALYSYSPAFFLFKDLDYTKRLSRAHIALGKWLAAARPADDSLAFWDMGAVPYFSGYRTVYDINPEGLLSPETARGGYNAELFVIKAPAFFVLYSADADRPAAGPRSWAAHFYASRRFNANYVYLFTFTFRPGYNLRVYVRRDVKLKESILDDGRRLAGDSRREL